MSGIIYHLTHRDPKNVLWGAKITDNNNPYNVSFSAVPVGLNLQFTFLFDPLPADAMSVAIGWSLNGIDWLGSETGAFVSPRVITLPYAAYYFNFIIHRPGGNEIFYLNTPAQVKVINGAASSISVSVVNNDEDVFLPIRAKVATIRFNSTRDINLNTFARGNVSDKRYYVEVYVSSESNVVFKGFLSLSDMSEAFLPPSNVVTLTASDKLGSLKDVKLVDFYNQLPNGYYTVAKYVAWCLYRTGIATNINVICNLREEHHYDRTWFDTTYLWSKTFEKDFNECEDCYTVLQKILGKYAVLFQRNGEWWIRSVDEWDQHTLILSVFDQYGELQTTADGLAWDRIIKRDTAIYFSNRRTTVHLNGEHKSAKLSFNYTTPREIICNMDMSRGEYVEDISSTEKKYVLDCWELKRGQPGSWGTPINEAFIKKIYNGSGYEIDRYAVITYPTYPAPVFLESAAMYVNQADKFSFNYEFKWSNNYTSGGGSMNVMQCSVRLDADDGSVYFLDDDGEWYLSNSTWSTNWRHKMLYWAINDIDERIWRNVSADNVAALPKSGKLYFMIDWGNYSDFADRELHIRNFSFEYIPYVNSSYKVFTGHYHKVEQTGMHNNATEDTVYLAESPSRLYKGTLLRKVGSEYELAGRFYNAAVFPSGPPDESYLHPFGYVQAYAVFNQVRRVTRTFRASVQGIDADGTDVQDKNNLPDLLHSWKLNDVSEHTSNKDFMLLSYDMDTYSGSFTGVLKEVYNRSTGKTYSDAHEHKYTS